ncbi:hypothetical protein [Haloarchaeobius sp. DFWS5]|uniref:hypothetical protein n=1 Tax=Haloarchaeobius sp. DFWS5 TaxID=3446114 RepID=UPI003EC02739
MSATDDERRGFEDLSLAALREDSSYLQNVVWVLLGLTLVWFHWLGLVVAGALVALPQRTFARGVGAGVGFGVLVVLLFVGQFALVGATEAYVDMGVVAVLPVAIGIALPTLGSLVRGIV